MRDRVHSSQRGLLRSHDVQAGGQYARRAVPPLRARDWMGPDMPGLTGTVRRSTIACSRALAVTRAAFAGLEEDRGRRSILRDVHPGRASTGPSISSAASGATAEAPAPSSTAGAVGGTTAVRRPPAGRAQGRGPTSRCARRARWTSPAYRRTLLLRARGRAARLRCREHRTLRARTASLLPRLRPSPLLVHASWCRLGTPLPIDPGKHVVVVRAPGRQGSDGAGPGLPPAARKVVGQWERMRAGALAALRARRRRDRGRQEQRGALQQRARGESLPVMTWRRAPWPS